MNDGELLTSITHGLRDSSRKMSKPKISKHIEFSRSDGWEDLKLCSSYGWTVMSDFTMVSLMSDMDSL